MVAAAVAKLWRYLRNKLLVDGGVCVCEGGVVWCGVHMPLHPLKPPSRVRRGVFGPKLFIDIWLVNYATRHAVITWRGIAGTRKPTGGLENRFGGWVSPKGFSNGTDNTVRAPTSHSVAFLLRCTHSAFRA